MSRDFRQINRLKRSHFEEAKRAEQRAREREAFIKEAIGSTKKIALRDEDGNINIEEFEIENVADALKVFNYMLTEDQQVRRENRTQEKEREGTMTAMLFKGVVKTKRGQKRYLYEQRVITLDGDFVRELTEPLKIQDNA